MNHPANIVRDMIGRNLWVECPTCQGNSRQCSSCKGSGIVVAPPIISMVRGKRGRIVIPTSMREGKYIPPIRYPRSSDRYSGPGHNCVKCNRRFPHEDRGVESSPWICKDCNPPY